jgi:hypothetical protein
MSVVIVLGAMWVHLVNGPFRAENPFTMNAVSQALRPGLTEAAFQAAVAMSPNVGSGLTEAARWAAKAPINPGSGSPPPTHDVDTIASRTI